MENEKFALIVDLTPIMKGFAESYVRTLNATTSAGDAGCTGKNLQQIGSELLRHPKVAAYIQYLRRQQMENMGVSQNRVLLELCRMAFVDPADMYDDFGCIKNIKDMPEDVRRSITQVDTRELYEQDGKRKKYIGDAKRVKLAPKEKALEMLARHVGLFQLDNLQQQNVTIVVGQDETEQIWQKLLSEY